MPNPGSLIADTTTQLVPGPPLTIVTFAFDPGALTAFMAVIVPTAL